MFIAVIRKHQLPLEPERFKVMNTLLRDSSESVEGWFSLLNETIELLECFLSLSHDGKATEPEFTHAAESIPNNYCDNTRQPIGPLEGSGAKLARAVTGRNVAKKSDLLKRHTKQVFVRQTGERAFEVYFRTAGELSRAQQRFDNES
jgi:hypothetical protein